MFEAEFKWHFATRHRGWLWRSSVLCRNNTFLSRGITAFCSELTPWKAPWPPSISSLSNSASYTTTLYVVRRKLKCRHTNKKIDFVILKMRLYPEALCRTPWEQIRLRWVAKHLNISLCSA